MPVFTAADLARPGFDLSMELLCSLPVEPADVKVKALTKDLGLANREQTQALIQALRSRGFRIAVSNPAKLASGDAGGGRVAWIPLNHWPDAQKAAERYWEQVWGEGHQPGGSPPAPAASDLDAAAA